MSIIHLQTTRGKSFELEVDPTTTISILKSRISATYPDISYPRLIFKGRFLQDDVLVTSLKLTDSDFLRVQSGRPPNAPVPDHAPPPAPSPPSESVLVPKAPPPVPVLTSAPLPALPTSANVARWLIQKYTGPLNDDAEFMRGVARLQEVGFARQDCEDALRSAYGNLPRAGDYLARGFWPPIRENNQDHVYAVLRQILMNDPRSLENLVRDYETMEPYGLGMKYRERPEELVAFFALDPSPFDFEAVKRGTAAVVPVDVPVMDDENTQDRLRSQVSDEEMETIERLVIYSGFPVERVIDAYLASERNELAAMEMLDAIKRRRKEE